MNKKNSEPIVGRTRLILVILITIGSFFLIGFPLFAGSYYSHVFFLIFLNVMLASGYRLLYVTGLGSFCHITFFAIGAYTSALLAIKFGFPFGICLLAAGIVAGIIATAFGSATVRTKGAYFFIISFAFWAVMDSVFKHWTNVTYGLAGIQNIPPVMGFTGVTAYYYIALVISSLTVFLMYLIGKSSFGMELLAIGDADNLAEAVGIDVVRQRVLALAIGAFFAGLAGSVFAHYLRYISPLNFGMWPTIYVLIWCVVGGSRKVWGPVVGAVLLTLIAELLRMSGPMQAIFYGITIVVAISLFPQGIAGLFDYWKTSLKIPTK